VYHLIDPAVAWVVGKLPGFLQSIVGSLLWLLILLAIGFGALLVFVAVVGIVAGPFNEMLSEAVEAVRTGQPPPKFSLGQFARDFARGLAHGLRRLGAALLGALLIFVLGFIPVFGSLAALALGFYFAARASAYDCYDAVLARQSFGYDAKLAYLEQRRSRTLGLGMAVAGCLFVPGLNLIVLGLGATGATLAWLDEPTRPA
jgi:CysZ protein